MKNYCAVCFIVSIVAGLAACSGGSSNGGSTPTGTGSFRVVNGIADTSTAIDASLAGISTTLDADFGTGSGFADIPIGSYKATMTAQASGGQPTQIIDDNVPIEHDVQTSVYAVGVMANSSEQSFTVTRPTTSFASGETEVQFVNATSATAPNPGVLIVYFVAPGSGLGGITTPAANFTPESLRSDLDTNSGDQGTPVFGQPVDITSGKYEVIVTGPDSSTALYDSGPGAGIAFTSGDTLQIAIMDVTSAELGQYSAALQLVLLDNNSGGSTAYFNGTH